jgi:uncharacterized membrane protein
VSWLMKILGIPDPERVSSITSAVLRSLSEPPVWLWVGVCLIGVALACLNLTKKLSITGRTRIVLSLLRLVGIATILAILFQTQLKLGIERKLLPKIALLTDRSGSMQVKDVEGEARSAAAEKVAKELSEKFADRAAFVPLHFSNALGSDAEGAQTALAASLKDALNLNEDFRAFVVLTDGRDTDGRPVTEAAALAARRNLPVHSVVFGGSEVAALDYDLALEAADEAIRLGNKVSISGSAGAPGHDGRKVQIALLVDGKQKIARNFTVMRGRARFSFEHRPEKARRYRYEVRLVSSPDDPAPQNNFAVHNVEVIDRPIRVIYFEHHPRFESKFLMHILESDPGVSLLSVVRMPGGGWYVKGKAFHENPESGVPSRADELFNYDVIILGDLPRKTFSEDGDRTETRLRNIADFVTRRGGGLVTLGGRHVYIAGHYGNSPLAEVLPFDLKQSQKEQLTGKFFMDVPAAALNHPAMHLGPAPEKWDDLWKDMVQLEGCNTVGNVRPAATLLGYREMGESRVPVLASMKVGRGGVVSAAFDTSWRWQLARSTEESYARIFWGNVIRHLAPDPRREANKPTIEEYAGRAAVGQTLHLASELVDDFFQPIVRAPLEIHVVRPGGELVKHYPSDIPEAPGLYEYDIELPVPGTYKIETHYLDKKRSEKIIEVKQQADEFLDVSPDAAAMSQLAKATNGVSVESKNIAALLAALDVEPKYEQDTADVPLWNHPLTIILFILVVCLDCLIRKRGGLA